MILTMPAVSREYIYVPHVQVFRHGEPLTGAPLQALRVEFAFVREGAPPRETDWRVGQWQEDPFLPTSPTAVILIGAHSPVPLSPGSYTVWLRVVGAVMAPTRPVGTLNVT